jgi:hypothetical protein
MLDPGFWEDLTIGRLSRDARLCFLGLLSHADDEGRVEADARYVKRAAFGFDDDLSVADVEGFLHELRAVCSNIVFYEAGGRRLAAFTNWRRYQYIQKPQPSKLPPPPAAAQEVPVPDEYDTDTVPVTPNRREQKRINAAAVPEIPLAYEYGNGTIPAAAAANSLLPSLTNDAQLRPKQAAWAVAEGIITSADDLARCVAFVAASDADKPGSVLWSQYIKQGVLPPDVAGRRNGRPRPPDDLVGDDLQAWYDEHAHELRGGM